MTPNFQYTHILIYAAFFLFPIVVATVQHGGGGAFLFVFIVGLLSSWSAWRLLNELEKKVLYGFVIFTILICLSVYNSEDIQQGMSRLEKLLHFVYYIPMYLLLKKYHIETGKIFLLGLLVSSIVMCAQAFYQTTIVGLGRAVGAYNPLIIGDISMLVAMLIICAILTIANKWQHFLVGAFAFCLAVSASVLSGSRGAWLLLPISILWFIWINRKSMLAKSALMVVALGAILITVFLNNDRVFNGANVAFTQLKEYIGGSPKMNSVAARLEMWVDSTEIWLSHPVIGTGLGDFGNDRYQLFKDGKSRLKQRFGHAHSIYFYILAVTGIVGFIAMLVFMQIVPFRMFYSFWVRETEPWVRFYALSGMTAIVAFAVFGLTEAWLLRNSFVRTYLMCILVFMSSIAVAKAKKYNTSVLTGKDIVNQ